MLHYLCYKLVVNSKRKVYKGVVLVYNMEEFTNPNEDYGLPQAKSSVKLIKNTKGINWEIKVVEGEAKLMNELMEKAIEIHKNIEKEVIRK